MTAPPSAASRRAARTTLALVLVSAFLLLAALPGAAAVRVRPVQFECELKGRTLLTLASCAA